MKNLFKKCFLCKKRMFLDFKKALVVINHGDEVGNPKETKYIICNKCALIMEQSKKR